MVLDGLGGPSATPKALRRVRLKGPSQRRTCSRGSRGQSGTLAGRGPCDKEHRRPGEPGKGKDQIVPWSLQRDTLLLVA